ncbi:hypothetical protein IW16_09210 [Chryseobacterium vrystaatense]|uniref:Uncharacterized protein n=1 Tax=Chryseobacterium vrystaatense TaxID=307480 RepID=A0ABR4UQJ7_9FLAO|nr:hypothetical protein IW16_09210 [Chryseobacterium vrystaatense]
MEICKLDSRKPKIHIISNSKETAKDKEVTKNMNTVGNPSSTPKSVDGTTGPLPPDETIDPTKPDRSQ